LIPVVPAGFDHPEIHLTPQVHAAEIKGKEEIGRGGGEVVSMGGFTLLVHFKLPEY